MNAKNANLNARNKGKRSCTSGLLCFLFSGTRSKSCSANPLLSQFLGVEGLACWFALLWPVARCLLPCSCLTQVLCQPMIRNWLEGYEDCVSRVFFRHQWRHVFGRAGGCRSPV